MRLYLFGTLRYEKIAGQPQLLSGNMARLLAYLALSPHPVSRTRLAGTLFSDLPDEQARRLLTHTLYRLKKELGEANLHSQGDQIALRDLWTDLAAFEQGDAVELYTDDLLTSLDDSWLLGRRASLREQFLQRIAAKIDRASDPAGALKYAQRWTHIDPLDETAQLALLRLYLQLGRHTTALQHYMQFKQLLWDELAVAPLPELQQLAASIRAERKIMAHSERMLFIGRKSERAQLLHLLDRQTGIAFISGDSGIGKSSLLDEVAKAAAWRQIAVARGEGKRNDGASVLDQALRQTAWQAQALSPLSSQRIRQFLAPNKADQADSPRATHLPLEFAVRQLLEQLTEQQPLLLLLDDMQWADDGTFGLLTHVAELTTRQRLIVVLAFRTTIGGDAAKVRWLAEIDKQFAPLQMSLAGFDEMESAEFAHHLNPSLTLQEIAKHHRQAGGNPLILRELLRNPAANSPTLERLLTQRLANLSAEAYGAVQAASVIGAAFELSQWQMLIDAPPISELLGAEILRENDGYHFQHDAVRQHLYESLSDQRRRELHGQLAERLQRHRADSAEIARHWESAEKPTLAATFYRRVAKDALALGMRASAMAHCQKALALTNDALPLRLLALQIAQLEAWSGKHADEAERIEQLAIAAGDIEIQHGVAMAKLKYLAAQDALTQLAIVGEKALALAHTMADPEVEVNTMITLVYHHISQRRDLLSAEPLAHDAVTIAKSLSPSNQIAAQLALTYLHFSQRNLAAAQTSLAQAETLFANHPDPTLEAELHTQQAFVAQLALDDETALTMQEWLAAHYLETGNFAKRKGTLWMVAQLAQNCGLLSKAILAAETMLQELMRETVRGDSAHAMMARAMLGECLVLAGEVDSAEEVLTPLINWLPEAERGMRTLRGWETVGTLYFFQQKFAAAHNAYSVVLDLAQQQNAITPTPLLLHAENAFHAGEASAVRKSMAQLANMLDLDQHSGVVCHYYYLRYLLDGDPLDLAAAYNRMLRRALEYRTPTVRHAVLQLPRNRKIIAAWQQLKQPQRVNVTDDLALTVDDRLLDATVGKVARRRQRIVRLIGEAIYQESPITLAQIANLLDVTTRTLSRDVQALGEQGIRVRGN